MVSLLLRSSLACLVVVLTYPGAWADQWNGTVTHCDGDALLRRDGEFFEVVRGAGVMLGDEIETGPQTRLSISLRSGPAITLGRKTSLTVDQFDSSWSLELSFGQIRLVHDGHSKCSLRTSEAILGIERAIVQVASVPGATTCNLVTESIVHCQSSASKFRIRDPGTYQITTDGLLNSAAPIQWGIDPNQIRLAAAMQTSPVLQPPTGAGLATQVPGQGSPNPPVESEPAVPPGDLSLDEEDEPRFAQDPLAPSRGPVNQPSQIRGGAESTTASSTTGAISSTFAGSSSLSLGSLSSATGSFASGGLFGDANQQTFQGQVDGNVGPFADGSPFPGAIHLVTAETRLPFTDVKLSTTEFNNLFSGSANKYYSIGTGADPSGQVVTNFFTGTSAVPKVIGVPGFNAHLIELDQYAVTDPVQGGLDSNIGLTGLLGPTPTGPIVVGATPLVDERAKLNQGATFALGEFLVASNGSNGLSFAIRRSDQDRLIVKDPGGDDAQDKVTPNTDVTFMDSNDPRFLPQQPTVKVPDTVANTGTGVADLSNLRRAALTTLVADQLQDYSRRSGQTRFVVDGKIIDISGYRPNP